jgi:nucleotide-binding universal stress UspA family protein
MSYRSLLVHLDQGPLAGARSEAAIGLARAFDCHLVGVAPTGLVFLPAYGEAAMPVLEYGELAMQALRDAAGQAAQRFRAACSAARLTAFEAIVDEAQAPASLVRHAQCSDLTVLTQADPGAPDRAAAQALVEQMVLHSARPTLILPCAGRIEHIGSTVLAAWDDSREAARALSDALPLLARAGKVHVMRWHEARDDDSPASMRERLEAVRRWLQRHGVAAEVRVEAGDIGVGEAMLSRAADVGADLIVMGAYGHARWAERMLGGATRGLLASMTVPVLMSH